MCDTCGCNITDGNRHLIEGDGKLAQTESGKEAIPRDKGSDCPRGWYKSDRYCVKQ